MPGSSLADTLRRPANWLSDAVARAADRYFVLVPLPPDRYGRSFFAQLALMLAATALVYWLLVSYWRVLWFAGEDGLVEWATVGSFTVAAILAGLVARALRGAGHRRIALMHGLLGVMFLLIVLEEISWGQRIFGWDTPDAIAQINFQDETTLHNIESFDRVTNTLTAIAAVLVIVAGSARLILHRRGLVTSANLLLPSLVFVPPLVLVIAWNAGGTGFRDLADVFGPRPVGDEAPELLESFLAAIYCATVLARASALRRIRSSPA